MIEIDGARGEGGGQIVRTSLALSLLTGKAFRITKIRAGREKPGLRQQHLTAVKAAAEVGQARRTGVEVGSKAFTFEPGTIKGGDFLFDVGTAGSTMLVLQTILPVLMLASVPSRLRLIGGTHNPMAPPFDFIDQTFVPLLNRMGPMVKVQLKRYGFYPAGGGQVDVAIQPAPRLAPLRLLERIAEKPTGKARALVCRLPTHVGERELKVVRQRLGWDGEVADNQETTGNVLTLSVPVGEVTETITSIGERGLAAETVASRACDEAESYLRRRAPVGEHLADQLLLPLALAGSGEFLTGPPTLHTTTNIETIALFLPVRFQSEELSGGVWRIWLDG